MNMIDRVIFVNFVINVFLISLTTTKQRHHGPGGMEDHNTTTCDEFSKYARFNPYSVLDSKWMVFYYWAPATSYPLFRFYVPGKNESAYLRKLVDRSVKQAVNWTARHVLMKKENNETSLLVERNDRGEFDLYKLYEIEEGTTIESIDVRIKQTGDNRYLGFMWCKADEVYALARLRDVPLKSKIQDVAARLGYRGRGGKSYLYQGHQWLPIPEEDERLYWQPARRSHWYLYE